MKQSIQDIILFCAQEEECPLPTVINDIARQHGISVAEAVTLFKGEADFVINNEDLNIECSKQFWVDVEEIDKAEFFKKVTVNQLTKRDTPPFFYISYALTRKS